MFIYARHDVPWLWFVDPGQRMLEVLQLAGDVYSTIHVFGGDDVVRADPFPEAEIDLASIWGPTEE